VIKLVKVYVAKKRKLSVGAKMAGRHGNKGVVSKIVPEEDMPFLPDGSPVHMVLNPLGVPSRMNIGQVLETHLGWAALKLGFRAVTPVFDGAREIEIEAELARAWMIDEAWKEAGEKGWEWLQDKDYTPESLEDDNEVRLLYLEEYLGQRGYDVYRLPSEPVYARRSYLREWLRDHKFDPDQILIFEDSKDNVAVKHGYDTNAINACYRMWMHDLGYDVQELADGDLKAKAQQVMIETGRPIPTLGKQPLRDGKTGAFYDQPITVGVMTMLKLHHLVEDKVHARSTGPYSLVTQQPLGGKAQFGGQRFGEMEVWALEAYGAAYTLQEMLTVKSDDVTGRVNTYEAIVKGEPIEEPSIPASFRVLVKELQSLGLAVEAVTDTSEMIRFGKDEEKVKPPRMGTGLLGLGGFGDL
jgi:DNA-directed RNA polymerase subunit beta